MKSLVIANSTGYGWEHIKYWVKSLQETGYSGDIVITGSDMNGDLVQKLSREGILLNLFGARTEDGGVETKGKGVPHVERFFYIWSFLQENKNKYDYVVTTDIRDVIFQHNPINYIESPLNMYSLIAATEGLKYIDEPWGNKNLYQAFGPHFYNKLKNNIIKNVGVIAGTQEEVEGLLVLIFQMSLGRPIPIVDQAVYNFLLTIPHYVNNTYITTHNDPWVANLGTTLNAVTEGHGDLGQLVKSDPGNQELQKYNMAYVDVQPIFTEDGIVKTSNGETYAIVHQWDRVGVLKDKIEERYKNV